MNFFVLNLFKYSLFLFFFLFQFTSVNADNLSSEDLTYYYNLSKDSELKKEHIKKICGGNGEFSLEIKDCFIKENDKVYQAVMQSMNQQNSNFKKLSKIKAPPINAPKGATKEEIQKMVKDIVNENKKKKQEKIAKDKIKWESELDYYYKLNYDNQLEKEHLKKVCGKEYIMGEKYSVEVKECFTKEMIKMNDAFRKVRNSENYKSPAEIKREKLKALSPNDRLDFQGVIKANIKLTLICDIKDRTFHSKQSVEVFHQIDFVKNKNKYNVYLDGVKGLPMLNQIGQQKMGDLVYQGNQIEHHPDNLFNTKKYTIIGLEFSSNQYQLFKNKALFRNSVNPATLMFNTSVTDALENKSGDFYLKTYFTGKTYSTKPDQMTGRTEKLSDHALGKCEIR